MSTYPCKKQLLVGIYSLIQVVLLNTLLFSCAGNVSNVPSPRKILVATASTSSSDALASLDQQFMTSIAQDNTAQIQIGNLTLIRSKVKGIKDFSQQLIQNSTDSQKKLTAIANARRFKLPLQLTSDARSSLTALEKIPDQNFNRASVRKQTRLLIEMQAELQKYLQQAHNKDLKEFSIKFSPIIAKDLQKAKELSARL